MKNASLPPCFMSYKNKIAAQMEGLEVYIKNIIQEFYNELSKLVRMQQVPMNAENSFYDLLRQDIKQQIADMRDGVLAEIQMDSLIREKNFFTDALDEYCDRIFKKLKKEIESLSQEECIRINNQSVLSYSMRTERLFNENNKGKGRE